MGEAHRRTEDFEVCPFEWRGTKCVENKEDNDEFTIYEKCQLVTKKQRTREAYRKRLKNTNNKT